MIYSVEKNVRLGLKNTSILMGWSVFIVNRCQQCQGIYNLYSGTVFEQAHFSPEQLVLLLRGIFQGVPTTRLAEELNLSYKTALKWRHRVQAQAETYLQNVPLPDDVVEVDEMFQTAGEKR